MENKQKPALALVTKSELSMVEDNMMNQEQLAHILKKTPAKYIHQRPAKGGGKWEYVTGGYVKKVLNLMFGWDWDFEIVESTVEYGEVTVLGRLTGRANGKTIVKMQYGNKEIIFKKQKDDQGNRIPLSVGNDKKAAATDALKKCAAEIGIAADIYNKMDFTAVKVVEDSDMDWDELEMLFEAYYDKLKSEDVEHARRIIKEKEVHSYTKLLNLLNQFKNS